MKNRKLLLAVVLKFGVMTALLFSSCAKPVLEEPLDRPAALMTGHPQYPHVINPNQTPPVLEDNVEKPFRYDFPEF